VNVTDAKQHTPLMFAAQAGGVALCKLLLNRKADVQRRDQAGMTALMYAARQGSVEVVRELLQAKAEVNVHSNEGRSALAYADPANGAVVEALRKAGAN